MKRLNPWLIVLFVLALFLMFSQAPLSGRSSVNYTQFKTLLEGGQVERVIVAFSGESVDQQLQLVRALRAHEGTLVFVSHDRAFLRALATRVLELAPGAPPSGCS
mgnify:CR=1 FL=1